MKNIGIGSTPRRNFIGGLVAASGSLLAGCNGTFSPRTSTASASNSLNVFDLMRKTKVFAFQTPAGEYLVLPEWRDKLKRSRITPQTCAAPLSNSGWMTVMDICATPPPPPPTIITVYSNGYGSATYMGSSGGPDFYNISGSYAGNYWGGSSTSPVYQTAPPGTNCVGETLTLGGTIAGQIGAWLKANAGRVSPNIYALWASYTAGEISAMEVLGTFLGIASAGDLLLILGAIGITVGGLYLLVKCVTAATAGT